MNRSENHMRTQNQSAPARTNRYLLSGEAGAELSLGEWTIGLSEDGSRADLWSENGPLTELRGDWRASLRRLRDLLTSPALAAALGEPVIRAGTLLPTSADTPIPVTAAD